jgi:protein-disulfide isomerase
MDAAILAEYFESKSPQLGVQFREFIFSSQAKVTRRNLRSYADQFAQQHGTGLPFVLDPQGKLAETVKQDRLLGQRIGITHTPTIYVVTAARQVEVTDRSRLFQLIEQAKAAAGGTQATSGSASGKN